MLGELCALCLCKYVRLLLLCRGRVRWLRHVYPVKMMISGVHKGELVWAELLHCRARQIIHNPRYAGVFVFGRTKQRHLPNGKVCSRLVPSEEWILLRDMHPGYITGRSTNRTSSA